MTRMRPVATVEHTLTSARAAHTRAQAALLRAERALVAAALREARGRREKTAALLGWSLRSLVRYLGEHRELAELHPGHPPNPPPPRTPDGRRWATP